MISMLKIKVIKLIALFFSMYFLSFYSKLIAAPTVSIKNITSETLDDSTVVQVFLDQEIGSQAISSQDHGSFIQVVIENSYVFNPGTFYDGNSEFVRKIAAFQVDENQAGIRLFVTKKAANILPALKIDRLGSTLALQIDHSKILGGPLRDNDGNISGVPSVKDVIKKTVVRNDIKDPAKLTQEKISVKSLEEASNSDSNNAVSTLNSGDISLKDNLNNIAIVSIAVIALLIFSVFSRKFLPRKLQKNENGDVIEMKAIANYLLTPKQKITLLDVAGQKILLSISPEQVNFLTTINDNSNHQRNIIADPIQYKKVTDSSANRIKVDGSQSISGYKKNPQVIEGRRLNHDVGFSEKVMPRTRSTVSDHGVDKRMSRLLDDASKGAFNVNMKHSSDVTSVAEKSRSSINETADNLPPEPKSIEDVTKLIRRKLKDLPKI